MITIGRAVGVTVGRGPIIGRAVECTEIVRDESGSTASVGAIQGYLTWAPLSSGMLAWPCSVPWPTTCPGMPTMLFRIPGPTCHGVPKPMS